MFSSVLVANRGEIARRIVRTCDRLGIRTVVMERDFLDIEAVIAAGAGCDAVHPGYGFLSESPALARACADAGLVFIGPSPEAMEKVGDKERARALATEAGVPVLPAYEPDAVSEFPVLVKAVAGGGGRGMRVVSSPSELDDALAAARREATAGFGDDRVFIEKYVERARHIEVQLLGDVALGERECSLQRRHQKVIEEAPSPFLDAEMRATLLEEASALARAAGYENAGTAEFLFNADDPSEHYFLEMNARLQVEHPVTELVTGLDLVECQLRIACGESWEWDGRVTGHAVEARVTAENADWLPQTGRILRYVRPTSARVDDGIEEGDEVGSQYDSLLAKVVVGGASRDEALDRLDAALAETTILGVVTSTGVLRNLLALPEVRAGEMTTSLVERVASVLKSAPKATQNVAEEAAAIDFAAAGGGDGWRLGGVRAPSWWLLEVDGETVEVELEAGTEPDPTWIHARDGATLWLAKDGYVHRVREPAIEETLLGPSDGAVKAPMPGNVIDVRVAQGDTVEEGQTIAVMESMKMELTLTSPAAGTIERIGATAGQRVKEGETIAVVTSE